MKKKGGWPYWKWCASSIFDFSFWSFLNIFFFECVLLTLLLIARFVCTKISKTRGMLSKARSYVTKKSLLLFFFFLVYPYLTYCNIIWSSTYPTNIINRIYLLQKRIVQTICAADYRTPVNPFLKNMGTSLFSKFIANWKSRIIFILLDMPSHIVLIPAEQT